MKVKPEETNPAHKPAHEPTNATSEQIADLAPTEAEVEQVKGGVPVPGFVGEVRVAAQTPQGTASGRGGLFRLYGDSNGDK